MTDLLFIRRADGGLIQKGSPLLIRTERVIDREDDQGFRPPSPFPRDAQRGPSR